MVPAYRCLQSRAEAPGQYSHKKPSQLLERVTTARGNLSLPETAGVQLAVAHGLGLNLNQLYLFCRGDS